MCFSKFSDNKPHLVAESDIYCYKVLFRSISAIRNSYYSPYQRYLYRIGELYKHELSKEDISDMDSDNWLDCNVFHSYINLSDAEEELSRVAYHAALFGIPNVPFVVKCVIPKGSIYWKNSTEFASVSIKAVGIVTLEELNKIVDSM